MIRGFAPICDENARILIVGTMPSERSLAKGEYYGHPRNAFWPIMAHLAGKDADAPYGVRCDMLRGMGIALWDVLSSCEREGSLDSAIRDAVPNDFETLFRETEITRVFSNGKTAERLLKKYIVLPEGVTFCGALPATSPAYTLSFEKKKAAWEKELTPCLMR